MKNVLLISPNQEWNISGQEALVSQGFTCDYAQSGKEAQIKAHAKKFNYVFLDLQTSHHSALEVFKFLRTTSQQAKVFLTFSADEFLKANDLSEEKFLKMGAIKVLKLPLPESLIDHIISLGKVKQWETIKEIEATGIPEEETEIADSHFTSIKLSDFFEDTLAITDYYIRIGGNRYVKIAHRGERVSSEQLHKYERSGAEYLYFPTKDRHHFLGQQNSIAQAAIKKGKNFADVVIQASQSATDKFLEETATVGIQPQLLEEGKAICQNLYQTSMGDKNLKNILMDYEKFNPTAMTEAFLVTLFSTIICKNLRWVGPKTIDTLALGALLHDVGSMQLEESLRNKDESQMTLEEKLKFQQHPFFGAEAVKNIPGINIGVMAIVHQHHEYVNGTGYPNSMSSHKIYPLAKIVCLANGFSEFLRSHQLNAFDGLKQFLADREKIARYDSELIKNLILGIKS